MFYQSHIQISISIVNYAIWVCNDIYDRPIQAPKSYPLTGSDMFERATSTPSINLVQSRTSLSASLVQPQNCTYHGLHVFAKCMFGVKLHLSISASIRVSFHLSAPAKLTYCKLQISQQSLQFLRKNRKIQIVIFEKCILPLNLTDRRRWVTT